MSFFKRIFGLAAAPAKSTQAPSPDVQEWLQTHDAFFAAIGCGDLATISTIVGHYPEALTWVHTDKMRTPLVWAMDNDRLDSFTHLLDLGADVNEWVTSPLENRRAHINYYAAACDKPDFLFALIQRRCTLKKDNNWKSDAWYSNDTDLKDFIIFALSKKFIKNTAMLDMIRDASPIRKSYLAGGKILPIALPPPAPAVKDTNNTKDKEDEKIKKRLRALEKEVTTLRKRLTALENPPIKKTRLNKPKWDS
jgi:hypothetical protein